MLKKAGMLTVGVTAGLLAVAPLANAGVSDSDNDNVKGHSSKKDHDDDKDKGHKSKKHHGDADQKGNGNVSCENNAGDFSAEGGASELLGLAGGPILSGNNGNILSCNSLLNGNAVSIGVLGDAGAETA